jgi:hypothetical protein
VSNNAEEQTGQPRLLYSCTSGPMPSSSAHLKPDMRSSQSIRAQFAHESTQVPARTDHHTGDKQNYSMGPSGMAL